jgi:aminoglycoside 3-N-acetyltransferase
MVHAAMGKVGRLLNGPDALIGALLDAVGPEGTVLAYTDWDAIYDELLDEHGRVPRGWREHVPPFDPVASRAVRDNGVLAEFVRTTPGAKRSGNPGASVAAVGAGADWFTADHPLDYGYGEGSPFAKLVEARGKVLMVGAPLDTMTLLHHAEHLARIPSKRVRRYEVPFAAPDATCWRMVEEFDTSVPVVPGLPEAYFADVVREFLARGQGAQGPIGGARRCWSTRCRSARSRWNGWSETPAPVECPFETECRFRAKTGPSPLGSRPPPQRRYAFSSSRMRASPCKANTSATEAMSPSTAAIPPSARMRRKTLRIVATAARMAWLPQMTSPTLPMPAMSANESCG